MLVKGATGGYNMQNDHWIAQPVWQKGHHDDLFVSLNVFFLCITLSDTVQQWSMVTRFAPGWAVHTSAKQIGGFQESLKE